MKPLKISIENDELVIRVGVDTLAHAYEQSEFNNPYSEATGIPEKCFSITDPTELAKDVAYLLNEDDEVGNTSITKLLDIICQEAVDRGCLGSIETSEISKK